MSYVAVITMRTNFRVYANRDSRQWWQSVKGLLGQFSSTHSQLSALANCLTDGDVSRLADDINIFFHSISADLPVFNFNCVARLLSDIDVLRKS